MPSIKTSKQLTSVKPDVKGREPMTLEEKYDRQPTAGELKQMIEIAAYYRAQNRQSCPGSELDDWLAAENEICARYGIGPQALSLS